MQDEGGAPAGTLALVMELLCFCVARHNMRIKYFVLRNHCMEATQKLLKRREAWLGVAAVRFMRTCIGLKDEFYHRYLIRWNLLEPIVDAFVANGRRYNLLNRCLHLALCSLIPDCCILNTCSHLLIAPLATAAKIQKSVTCVP